MGDLLLDSFGKPVKVPDIVEAVRHAQRQQARIVCKSSERGIQIFRICINVQAPQLMHLPHDAALFFTQRTLIQELATIGMNEEIVEEGNRKKRRILQGFPESKRNLAPVRCVILTGPAFDPL